MLKLFLIFTGIYVLYFPCIQNKYWKFVIQKFLHLFIVKLKNLHRIPVFFVLMQICFSIALEEKKTANQAKYLS